MAYRRSSAVAHHCSERSVNGRLDASTLGRPRAAVRLLVSARRTALAVSLSALLSVGLLGACSGEGSGTTPAPNPTVAAPSASATNDATTGDDAAPESTPTAKPSLPPDPKAPAKVEPVQRSGSSTGSTKRVTGRSATFSKPVRWRDGVKLQVVDIKQGVTNGVGPGASQGAPMTTFELKLSNGSTKPLDASSVVLTTIYGGKSKLVAQPVYGQAGASDFSGTLAPGKSTTATYVYSIPAKQRGAVSLSVDLDGRHALVSFTGSAR